MRERRPTVGAIAGGDDGRAIADGDRRRQPAAGRGGRGFGLLVLAAVRGLLLDRPDELRQPLVAEDLAHG